MQPRLTRSRTDKMIAGVCGGLAEYFAIDPVIVRLIFALVTLTSGIGLLFYPVLWVLMPKAGPGEFIPHDPEAWRARVQSVGEEAAEFGQSVEREVRQVFGARQGGSSTSVGAPTTYADRPTEGYNFDPYTGQPIQQQQIPPPPPPRRRKGSLVAGIILVAMGIMFTAEFLGIPTDIIFPVLMIGAGVWMVVRR